MKISTDTIDTVYRALRPHAFAVAYRMLGSVSEAEDVVQDAFVRLARMPETEVASSKAFLTTVVSRLALDQLRSARARRETYVGTWLPEPLVGVAVTEPGDTLSMAVMVLLESLSPVERAVFVLHDIFEMDYAEVAAIVEKTEDNCRQIGARARQHVDAKRPRFEASTERRQLLAQRLFEAAGSGDLTSLAALLAADVAFHGDGGGKATAFPKPILGRDHVARVLIALLQKAQQHGVTLERTAVNGHPGAIFRDAQGGLINVFSLDVHSDGQIHTVRSVVNPDKLAHLGPLSPMGRR